MQTSFDLSQGLEEAYKRNLLEAVNTARVAASQLARVAELADAPDLGFRNRRFQGVPFVSKNDIYEGKTRFSAVGVELTTGE